MGNEQSSNNSEIKQTNLSKDYNVSIVGRMNSGKSSLLNVLLQSKSLLPVKAIRETSAIVKIKYHTKINPQLIIEYNNGMLQKIVNNEIEINTELKKINKTIRNTTQNINLTLMTKLINDNKINYDNIVLYDTPGLSENMDNKIFEIIKISNIVLFLMDISAISDAQNIKNYKQVSKILSEDIYKKIYIILTHIDNDDEDKTFRDWKYEVVKDFKLNGNIIIDPNNVIPISITKYNETNNLISSNINELIIKFDESIKNVMNIRAEQHILQLVAKMEFNNRCMIDNTIKNPNIRLPHNILQKYKKYEKENNTTSIVTGVIGGGALIGGIALSIVAAPIGAIAIGAAAAAESTMLLSAGALITTSIIVSNSSNVSMMLKKDGISDFDEYLYNDVLYRYYDDNISKKYEGNFKGGRYHGNGIVFYKNGNRCIEGIFDNGYLSEAYKIYDEYEREIFIGLYSNKTDKQYNYISIIGTYLEYRLGKTTYSDVGINKKIDTKHQYTNIIFTPSPNRYIIPRTNPFNQIPTEWQINIGDKILVKKYYYDNWYQINVKNKEGYIKIVDGDIPIDQKNEYTMYMKQCSHDDWQQISEYISIEQINSEKKSEYLSGDIMQINNINKYFMYK
jgi:GTPase Era involved in 16S rRNA processing